MKKIISVLVLSLATLIACEDREDLTLTCGTEATVRDLTGLDGCGFVFELNDGTRLEPVRMFFCGTPPLPAEVTNDPLYNFQFVDGKKVRIGYVETQEMASICMAGKLVKITCLEEMESSDDR